MPRPPAAPVRPRPVRRLLLGLVLLLAAAAPAAAQRGASVRGTAEQADQLGVDSYVPGLPETLADLERQGWLLRGSATFIEQAHPAFRSPYRGPNSLAPAAVSRNTFSMDLVIGRRLWAGAEAIVVPQASRGFGLSNTFGIAAFPNAEAYRLGSEGVIGYFSRAFLRQTIPLSGDLVTQDDDPMRFTRDLPRERLTFTAGKVSAYDFFDDNTYSHDPRTQFMNWALVSAGAFDAAADARGYTNGAALEWENGTWATRFGAFQVAQRANALRLDPQPFKGFQLLGEVDRSWRIGDRQGVLRIIGGASNTRGARWTDVVTGLETDTPVDRSKHRFKYMGVLNAEQAITPSLGVFARLAINDGRTEDWMFTEIDRSVSGGVALRGTAWGRGADTVGLAGHVGWLSQGHRRFLEEGGLGIIIGDGRLRYRPESILETYYDFRVGPGINLAANYQLAVNPGYNADRGPVSIFALRLRTAF